MITVERFYTLIVSSLFMYYGLCLCLIFYIMFVNEDLFMPPSKNREHIALHALTNLPHTWSTHPSWVADAL